jgi:hypothetical protein
VVSNVARLRLSWTSPRLRTAFRGLHQGKCPPTALVLPIAMIGILALPAGSSRIRLHELSLRGRGSGGCGANWPRPFAVQESGCGPGRVKSGHRCYDSHRAGGLSASASDIELVWLTGQLAPDFKTIADFRKDNGKAIREVCRAFVALCRELDLLSAASVAIDGHDGSNAGQHPVSDMPGVPP